MTSQSVSEDRLLTAEEAAAYLGCNTEMVRRWAKDGDLPFRSIGGRSFRFSRAELDAWTKAKAEAIVGRAGASRATARPNFGAVKSRKQS